MRPYSSFVPHYEGFPHDLFDRVAKDCNDTDILVEVGAFLGHGTCYMCERLAAYGKRPKFYAFDPWDQILEPFYGKMRTGDMPWGEPIEKWKERGGRLYDAFLFYMANCPNKDRLYDWLQVPANSSAPEFKDESLSFVFLNYAQDKAGIDEEIERWFPKVKVGGLMVIARDPVSDGARIMEKT